MTEYIERGALMQFPIRRDHYDRKNGDKHFINGIETVLEYAENLPAADAAPVVHGRWIFTKRHLWYKDENGNIDEWRVDNGFHNGPECQICHTAFCEHCTPDWSTTECEIGHYYCSECAETSRDAHENYCPSCGAKMDGGAENAGKEM